MNDLRMELKVCEGCGALWLRASSNTLGPRTSHPNPLPTVYCRTCVRTLANMRLSRVPRGRRTPRPRVRPQQLTPNPQPAAAVAGGAQ